MAKRILAVGRVSAPNAEGVTVVESKAQISRDIYRVRKSLITTRNRKRALRAQKLV